MNDVLTQVMSGSGGQIYIPSMNWDNLSRSIGFTSSLSHLQFSQHTQAEIVDITCSPAQQLIDLILTAHIDVPSNEFSSNIPLTSYGLDSLSASQLSFALNQKFCLKISQIQLLSNVSTDDLLEMLQIIQRKENTDEKQFELDASQLSQKLRKICSQYLNGASWVQSKVESPCQSMEVRQKVVAQVVVLTGSTGTLGAHILHHLMHAPDVQCIYALIRGNSDLEYLQTSAFQREGLEWQIPLHTKVKLVRYNPDIESLGITEADQKMVNSCNNIFANR